MTLIYVRWVQPTRPGRREMLRGSIVTGQAARRRSSVVLEPFSYDDDAGSTTQQACEVAREVSRKISAWEVEELRMPGDASVSTKPVGEDVNGWYFLRQSYDRAPVCMQDVG